MLQHLVERLRAVPSLDDIIIATTVNDTEECIKDFSVELNLGCYCSSEEDVIDQLEPS